MPSEFYRDGYRDGLENKRPSPPDVPVLQSEYIDGYRQGNWDRLKAAAKKPHIVPKRDFGSGKGFLINGEWVKSGFVVTDGVANIMPGATWFRTIPEALRGIAVLAQCNNDHLRFWELYREKQNE